MPGTSAYIQISKYALLESQYNSEYIPVSGGSGSAGYFIFKDIRVNEKLRDLKGDTTRAIVDVSFMQVPAYQVNTGRDQATATTAGRTSKLLPKEAQKSPAGAAAGQVDGQKNKLDPSNTKAAGGPTTNGTGGKKLANQNNNQIIPTTGRQR